jgi:hypothetical protein
VLSCSPVLSQVTVDGTHFSTRKMGVRAHFFLIYPNTVLAARPSPPAGFGLTGRHLFDFLPESR